LVVEVFAVSLAEKSCVPCRGGVPPLTAEEFAPLLAQLDGWQVEDDRKLIKSYRFKNFRLAVDFVNAIAEVAEAEGHHPDLYVRWGEVRVYLWTHKIDGLTESDFILAAKIDRVRSAMANEANAR
jgi:4a-hydroxytetrahydrobiopterin dehydratase